MKKFIQISMLVLMALCFCTACGGSKQMPDDLLKTAIQNEDSNYSGYGLEIKSFSVKDRNYDSSYKSESVTVEVRAENTDSTYEVVYTVVGSRQNSSWNVSSVQEVHTTVLPKESLPQGVVDYDIEQLLQEKENVRYYLTMPAYCEYSSALEDIEVDVQLCSDTQYLYTTKDYQLFYEYTLEGWELIGKGEADIKVQITDDLCGTWVASNGEDSYKFVIDHIEGNTAYVKYQAQFRMPHYTWTSRMISRGYDTLTPVPISVVYEDWKSDDYIVKIVFENSRYAQYVSEDTLDSYWSNPMDVGICVFPDHCPQKTYANGTVEDGKSYVLTDINMSDATKPVNGTYILTKQ
mgnify:CR=1 FL=1